MPLRLVEATIPNEDLAEIPELIGDIEVVHVWTSQATSESEGETGLARILLDSQHTEALSDLLVERYGSRDDFRLIMLAVEATLPVVEEPGENGDDDDGEAESESDASQRISREELYEDVAQASRLTRAYVAMVVLSSLVAAIGLIRGDVAIIIGAMVIAPLLGPNVALSLACTLGDIDLAKRSLKTIAAGVTAAALLSLLLGVVLTVDPAAPELTARTRAAVGDIVLALAAGAAGSLAFTSGVPAVVVGVMVAVALLPPLVVAGLLAGSGHWVPATGALVLLVTNVTCINLASVATFLLQKVRPRTWWEADRAKKATKIAVATWVVMLLVLLALMLTGNVGGV